MLIQYILVLGQYESISHEKNRSKEYNSYSKKSIILNWIWTADFTTARFIFYFDSKLKANFFLKSNDINFYRIDIKNLSINIFGSKNNDNKKEHFELVVIFHILKITHKKHLLVEINLSFWVKFI